MLIKIKKLCENFKMKFIIRIKRKPRVIKFSRLKMKFEGRDESMKYSFLDLTDQLRGYRSSCHHRD